MLIDGILTVKQGSIAASINYTGYLLGALLCGVLSKKKSQQICVISILGTTACLFLLSAVENVYLIYNIRFFAGVFSALSMVYSALWLFSVLSHSRKVPVLYSGVGIGIFFSSEILALIINYDFDSQSMWFSLGCVTFLIGAFCVLGLKRTSIKSSLPTNIDHTQSHNNVDVFKVNSLILIYGLSGFGYIITATYLPAILKFNFPNFNTVQLWAVFGLGAVPSCYFWHLIQDRFGHNLSLTLNLFVQAIGVLLPVFSQNIPIYILSAFIVGGSFMGTVTIAMSAAYHTGNRIKKNLVVHMTFAHGVGQIIGPIIANYLYNVNHSLSISLYVATFSLLFAAMLCKQSKKPTSYN